MRALELCKKNWAVLLLALMVGCLYVGPDVYHAFTPGYQGVLMADSTDANFYLTNINKSYQLHGLLGNPFLYEYQNVRNTFQYFVVEWGLGKIGAVFHLPIDVLTMGMEFIFPALLSLLLYALVLYVSRSKFVGFLASAGMLLGNEIVHPDGLTNLLHTFLLRGSYDGFLTYSRPVNPQVSSLFLFGFIFVLLYLIKHPRSKWAIVVSGVGLAALLYIYIYFWAFAAALFGVVFLYSLVMRQWQLTLATIAGGVVAIITMAPYMLQNVSVLLSESGGGLTQTIHSHHFIFERVVLLPLLIYAALFLWAWWSRGEGAVGIWMETFTRKYAFILLLICAAFVVSEQQVLTGRMLFEEHFHFFTNIPVFLLSMSVLCAELLLFLPRIWRFLAAGAIVFVLAWFVLGVQVSSFKKNSAASANYQNLMPLFEYLRNSAPAQSVVLTDPYISTQLTTYTQDFPYSGGGYDTTFQVPQVRIDHDYFVLLALQGITPKTVRAYLYANRDEVGYTVFTGTYWRDLCGSGGCFPDSVLENLVTEYDAFYTHPLLQNIKDYKADYLLWDGHADANWNIRSIISGPPILQSGDFLLYKIKS